MQRAQFIAASLGSLLAFSPDSLERIERRTGGRLGVMAIDTLTGRSIAHRAGERFPMCSTFKIPAAAAVLSRADAGRENLERRIRYGKRDLLDYAPITREHVAAGWMTVDALCAAAVEYSDNTAANLLIAALGGPHAVTAYARSIGDSMTRLDRTEPALNTGIPGDLRDTTTPAAMAKNVRTLLFGDALSRDSKRRLSSWLLACRTGTDLLRAGFPHAWRAGDKTGLGGAHNRYGDSDTRNDVAFAIPPGRPPIVVAAYLTQAQVRAAQRDAALADVGRLVAADFARG